MHLVFGNKERMWTVLRGTLLLAVLAGGLAAFDEPGTRDTQADPAIVAAAAHGLETFTLANGMDVVVIPDRRAPVVTHMVWYRVGAADEPPGKSGIAHFLEHLMFKGTEKVGPGQLSRIVARNGGRDNAFTSSDYTAYFQRVALDRLPLVMEMEADRMRNLTLTDAEVLPERDVVLEERRTRVDNEPAQILAERMNSALYGDTSYGIPVIGWEDEIRELTTADALDFYRRHYAPNNAILIVAGDVTADNVRPLAEKYYGPLSASVDLVDRDRADTPRLAEAVRIELRDGRVEQPHIQRSYLAPGYARADPRESAALDVLSELLGGGATSRLYRALVVDQGLAASAGTWFVGSVLGDGRFGVYALPRVGADLDTAEAAIDAEITRVQSELVSGEELERAKMLLVAEAVYARDRQDELARIYGTALTTGGTVRDVAEWPDRIKRVTAEEVRAVARKYLLKEQSVTGLLLPGDGA